MMGLDISKVLKSGKEKEFPIKNKRIKNIFFIYFKRLGFSGTFL